MNKRHTGKLLAFLLAVVFMFTLVPQVMADDGDDRDIGALGHVSIHNTNGDHDDDDPIYPWEGPSTLKSSLKINGDDVLGDSVSDVPIGATIKVVLAFHLKNSFTDPKEGDYFTFELPTGVSFAPALGIVEDEENVPAIKFADWSIVDNKLTVTMTNGIDELIENIWGRIEINGNFVKIEGENEDDLETKIEFGDQTIVINRKDESGGSGSQAQSKLTKKYNYNPEDNVLEWEVTIDPPAGETDYNYRDFTFVDVLTGPHKYIENTFMINGSQVEPVVGANKKSISYTFLDEQAAPLTISYSTTIDWVNITESDKVYKLKNEAEVLNKDGDPASNKGSATFELGEFFKKSGEPAGFSTDGKFAYFKWAITVTLPATPGTVNTLPNARIIDTLYSENHTYVTEDSDRPVMITGIDTDALIVTLGGDKGQYQVVESASEEDYLTYRFPSSHPKTGEAETVYVLTYYTKVSKETNDQVTVENKARLEWDKGDGQGGGSWFFGDIGVTKDVVNSGGLISKAPVSLENDYDHSAPYNDKMSDFIQWKIVVNANEVQMGNGISIEDTVGAGHEFVIDDAQTFTIKEKDGATVSLEKFYEDGDPDTSFILTKTDNGFKLIFLESNLKSTYTITFFTRLTDEAREEMYLNSSKTFENSVTLKGYGEDLGPVKATKTYNLQMLEKTTPVGYNHETREIEYKLVANRNRLPMTNAFLTDTLPEHVSLSPRSSDVESAFVVYVNGGMVEKTLEEAKISFEWEDDDIKEKFILTFEEEIDDLDENGEKIKQTSNMYEIYYWVRLEDDLFLTTAKFSVENDVKLGLDEVVIPFEASVETEIDYETVTKEHTYKAGDYRINWTGSSNVFVGLI